MRHPIDLSLDLAPFIDHTLLKATASEAAIETLCQEALTHGFHAVCVNGVHVARAKSILHGKSARGTLVKVASVVGFPLGAMSTKAKIFEAEEAVCDGASEIDMVMRIDLAKARNFSALSKDVLSVVKAVEGQALVKVILETSLLTLDEISESSRAAADGGAHFIKTCTGFSTSGLPPGNATVEHVALMRESVGPGVLIKASGGIKDSAAACALIAAGAARLGTSSGVALVGGHAAGAGY